MIHLECKCCVNFFIYDAKIILSVKIQNFARNYFNGVYLVSP
jgi:hypothetical protein